MVHECGMSTPSRPRDKVEEKTIQTKVVNLFGGPGIGKSRTASSLYSLMKSDGYNIELVTEFAKDLTWEENWNALSCQIFVSATQYYRQFRLLDKVDYIITDSPILLGVAYTKNDNYKYAIFNMFNEFDNINYFLTRDHNKYSTTGRKESLEQAIQLDHEIESILIDNAIICSKVKNSAETIFGDIQRRQK